MANDSEESDPDQKKKIVVVECEVYSRVVGYYRPVQNWNDGKQEEFSERHLIDPEKKD